MWAVVVRSSNIERLNIGKWIAPYLQFEQQYRSYFLECFTLSYHTIPYHAGKTLDKISLNIQGLS